ncbi:CpsD/CapB family tyrosine-protein kinase [Priestia koreensis]|uniref:non-specific protein-tyrosine kinase n=1 Tax=Priestia koreensis TaxID=284581 RepID=A0A0M0LHP8_9BACI|nr:CpsD/CapB family tyrosine-protein kinase [Priestia koreensis]KOO50437.1 capsular biosynthesis protein [Priestia koreensis]
MAKRFGKNKKVSNMRNLIAHLKPKSTISEQYRTIRTNIQFSNVDQKLRSIVVTSSVPGEGKSTTIANLATVFAQQDKRVLLIDGDLRKPTAHYTFRLENRMGLTNVLTKQTRLASAIQRSEVKNLDILTSGPIPPNPAELLASQAMANLFTELYEHYELIVFDSPPILPVTDAQILANQCDGAVLVVQSGRSDKEATQKAKELLDAAKGKLLGVVLNRKEQKASSGYYHYYGTDNNN